MESVDIDRLTNIKTWLVGCGVDDPAALGRLSPFLKLRNFGKKELIVREGERCGHAFFIERGMTRSYWVVHGEEVTTSFSTEGSIVFSMDEVYYGAQSQEYVETVEPVEAYAIALNVLHRLIRKEPSIACWWIRIHQDEYRRIHRSHKERLTLTAGERYREFERQFPDVCRRGRLSDIASYLGITPSTLSRLRAAKERFS